MRSVTCVADAELHNQPGKSRVIRGPIIASQLQNDVRRELINRFDTESFVRYALPSASPARRNSAWRSAKTTCQITEAAANLDLTVVTAAHSFPRTWLEPSNATVLYGSLSSYHESGIDGYR